MGAFLVIERRPIRVSLPAENVVEAKIPNSKWVSLEFCQKQLEDHFKSFSTNKIETLLFHDIKILFTKRGMKIFKNLEVLKKKKFFKKIGLSIYDTSCLNYLNSNYN